MGGDEEEAEKDTAGDAAGGMLWEEVLHDRGGAALRDWGPQAAHPGAGAPWRVTHAAT